MRQAGMLIALLAICAAGCRQNVDPNGRQARLAVATNAELERQVARYEAQIAEYEQQLQARSAELGAVLKLNEDLREEIRAGVEARVADVASRVVEDNARLRREIEALRAEVAALRASQ